jgi:hypothetical protein
MPPAIVEILFILFHSLCGEFQAAIATQKSSHKMPSCLTFLTLPSRLRHRANGDFQDLPIGIRLMIWELLLKSRVITIDQGMQHSKVTKTKRGHDQPLSKKQFPSSLASAKTCDTSSSQNISRLSFHGPTPEVSTANASKDSVATLGIRET